MQYRDRTLTKSENMTRKTYGNESKYKYERDECLYDAQPAPPSPFNVRNSELHMFRNYDRAHTPVETYDNVFTYDTHDVYLNNHDDVNEAAVRRRALSFSDSQEVAPKKNIKSIRDRNRRRQSYNPRAYADYSSSDSDCTSLGSTDGDWRRRNKRLGRLTSSNSSIKSEFVSRHRGVGHFLKPEANKTLGRSPPPCSSILSGLSPTSASRVSHTNNSPSSDSSL